jgi:hypothetical protein
MLRERLQVDIGCRIALKDASQLPQECWVSIQTGTLYRAREGHSLTAVVSAEPQEFLLAGTPDKTPYPQMRQRAREHGVEPQLQACSWAAPACQDEARRSGLSEAAERR